MVRSLLPYLAPSGAGTCLSILPISKDPATLSVTRFPFLLVSDSDPLTRLIEAQFQTDSGSPLKKVFLLVQRDNYLIPRNQMKPLTNPVIEDLWRKAFTYYREKDGGETAILLSGQYDENGLPMQMQSLFFCKSRGLFFHPACPSCGGDLEQCADDRTLRASGLQGFTSSTQRYLHCPSCFSSGKEPIFYAYELGGFDPPCVKDRADLIREFASLVGKRGIASGLPCSDCSQSDLCFGQTDLALKVIFPFSFYPFFTLIFESMSVNGEDFLAMLSGASHDDLEARLIECGEMGRLRHIEESKSDLHSETPFLFHDAERLFLEVLYLKLTFLSEVMRGLCADACETVAPVMSVDRIWARFTAKSALLPFFWNFDVRTIGIFKDPFELPLHPRLSPLLSVYSLGLLWFQALLSNSSRDFSAVRRKVEDICGLLLDEKGTPKGSEAFGGDPFFNPENIFWKPHGGAVRKEVLDLWNRSLDMGFDLLNSGLHFEPVWSRTDFQARLDTLREEIKRRMFEAPTVRTPVELSRETLDREEDERILNILTGVMDKWKSERAVQPPIDAPLAETVVLSRRDVDESSRFVESPQAVGVSTLSETVALAPGAVRAEPRPSPPAQPFDVKTTEIAAPPLEAPVEDLNTVVFKPSSVPVEPDLPETIVISPAGERRSAPPHFPAARPADAKPEPGEGPLFEPNGPVEPEKAMETASDEDLLTETIILNPRKDKDK